MKSLIEALDEISLFENDSAQEFAKISSDLKNRGQLINVMDELIASICISNQEALYTRNIKHFERIEELVILGHNSS